MQCLNATLECEVLVKAENCNTANTCCQKVVSNLLAGNQKNNLFY